MVQAVSILGLGEFWTGVLAPIVVGLAFWLVLASTDYFDHWPWQSMNYDLDDVPDSPPVARGVLVCDWVDVELLASIARQKKVEPEPVRIEKGEARTHSGGVDAGPKWLRLKRRGGRQSDQRSFYEFANDPNAMLAAVLSALEREGGLYQELDVQPYANLLNSDVLNQVLAAAHDQPEAQTARDAIESIQQDAITLQKRNELQEVVKHERRFIFVESRWRVTDEGVHEAGDEFWLELVTLRPAANAAYYRRDDETAAIPVPPALSIAVRVSADRLTPTGKHRISDGRVIEAGVLATIEQMARLTLVGSHPVTDRLFLTPVAVFARVSDH